MITGAYFFNSEEKADTALAKIVRKSDSTGLVFNEISVNGFIGGYYLNPRLPYRDTDFYYSGREGDLTILLSGCIYNRKEIAQQLGADLEIPDPELIARLFLREGPGFVQCLNGDFAIFIIDKPGGAAYLFRDHIGIRPMAWATSDRCLIFSTDIVALCRALPGTREPDIDYLLGYFKYADNNRTPDSRVIKLLPGHYLHFSDSNTVITRYWEPEKIKIDRHLTYDEMLSDLGTIVSDAVRIRCDKRFNGGAHLSSGLDSALVSALARREYSHQESFYGFSWSPERFDPGEVKYDEREIIKRFSLKEGIIPVFTTLEPAGLRQIISSPYGNPSLFYEDRTMDQAVLLGANLIFSGWGGDEFISTGDRGVEQDLLRGFRLRTFFKRNPLRPFGRFVLNQLKYVIYPSLGILDKGTAESFKSDARYLKEQFRKSDRKAISTFFFHRSRRHLHLNMLIFGHLQRRCEGWMINGYRKGIEYRYPLLDRRIIEYMLKVPSHLLCVTGTFRPILRELGKGILPDEIRMNYSKTDPVSWAYTRKLYRDAALSLLCEAETWENNPDLFFIDFDQMGRDAESLENSAFRSNSVALYKSIVSIKYLHEYTRWFRDN